MQTLKENIDSEQGDVWVLIKAESFNYQHYRDILDSLVEYVINSGLGDIDGESMGLSSIDINFMVKNKEYVATRLYHRTFASIYTVMRDLMHVYVVPSILA